MWSLLALAVDILLLQATQNLDYIEVQGSETSQNLDYLEVQGQGKWRTLTTWEMDTVKFTQVKTGPVGNDDKTIVFRVIRIQGVV